VVTRHVCDKYESDYSDGLFWGLKIVMSPRGGEVQGRVVQSGLSRLSHLPSRQPRQLDKEMQNYPSRLYVCTFLGVRKVEDQTEDGMLLAGMYGIRERPGIDGKRMNKGHTVLSLGKSVQYLDSYCVDWYAPARSLGSARWWRGSRCNAGRHVATSVEG
jgi:hypothetical protein